MDSALTGRTCLDDFLTDEQKQSRNRFGYFMVKGSEGGIYELHTERFAGSITRRTGYRRSFCCHIDSKVWAHLPGSRIHTADLIEENLIALLLTIKTNEHLFLMTAH